MSCANWVGGALVVLTVASVTGLAQAQAPRVRAIDSLEQAFDSLRYLRDQFEVTRSRGATASIHGVSVEQLTSAIDLAKARFLALVSGVRRAGLSSDDRRAFDLMRRDVSGQPAEEGSPPDSAPARCPPDATAEPELQALTRSVFVCYGRAAQGIAVDRDTLDRLSILSLLATTEDPGRRERLFRALDRVWSTVNGHDEPDSPYRKLIELRRQSWGRRTTPMDRGATAFGLSGAAAEQWLVAALEAWRRASPDGLIEPWDYYYAAGAASRALSPRIPLDSLLPLDQRFYSGLGASPSEIGVERDLAPRTGKYPIAFTTFGARPLERGGQWVRAEPWVFASYRIGGFDNLAELLHETGHAIHIAAIRTRPAYADWPEGDSFTEGIADLATLEIYEPLWQVRALGDSVPLAESLRAKYSSIMLDIAWSLFEIRVHRAGAASPNQVWTDITSRYLRIRPHPELSWWAMRGQLIESPGYMLNYALGAFLVADLRDAIKRRFGDFTVGRPDWYRQVSSSLYRFGRSRTGRAVTEGFLGRAVKRDALLIDLARMNRP